MKNAIALLAALALLLALPACGAPPEEETPQPTQTPTPAEMNADQLHELLDSLQKEDASPEELLECFDELDRRDSLTQSDREALAELYGETGQDQLRREELLRLLLLYPSEGYMEELAEIIALRSGTEADRLGAETVAHMANGEAAALRDLVNSQAWNEVFQDGLRAVELRSIWTDGTGTLQSRDDYERHELTYLREDGDFWYFITDGEGTTLASALYAEGAYNGPVTVDYLDTAGEPLLRYTGTLANNLCTVELTVTYDGIEYTGALNEDGTAAAPQEADVTGKGGVIYARNGNRYLYKSGVTQEDFVLDCAFLGLPEYTPWE